MDRSDVDRSDVDRSEVEVRTLEADYDQAWQDSDLDRLVDCLHDDVVLVSPRGRVAMGRDAARAELGTFLATEAADTVHSSRIDRVSFVGDDVAVVDGMATISRNDGEVVARHALTDVLRRTGDRWRIAHVRAGAVIG